MAFLADTITHALPLNSALLEMVTLGHSRSLAETGIQVAVMEGEFPLQSLLVRVL